MRVRGAGVRGADQMSPGAGDRYSVGFGRLAEKWQRVRVWAATVALVSVMLSAAACGGAGESGREAGPETTRSAIEETTAETARARKTPSTGETTQASAPVCTLWNTTKEG